MLTLREALTLPVFASVELVGGGVGLDGEIKWVHVGDSPEALYGRPRAGGLWLTALDRWLPTVEKQEAFLNQLADKGFVGLGVHLPPTQDQLPEGLVAQANTRQLALLAIPHQLRFAHIAEELLTRIVKEQRQTLVQTEEIHERLFAVVHAGGNPGDLVSELAWLIDRSITFEDSSFQILGQAQHDVIDEARRRSMQHGRTTSEVAERLLKTGVYQKLLSTLGLVTVPPIPALGMTIARAVMPVVVGEEIFGYFWVIVGSRPLSRTDEIALEYAATVAAMILFREQSERIVVDALRNEFFNHLLNGDLEAYQLAEQAQRLKFQLAAPYQILIVFGPPEAGGTDLFLLRDVIRWTQRERVGGVAVRRESATVLVLNVGPGQPEGEKLAHRLLASLSHPARRLRIGVSSRSEDLTRFGDLYAEAWEALHIGSRMQLETAVVSFDSLGFLHWLYHIPASALTGNRYREQIGTLNAYDRRRGTELVSTLEAYLDGGGNLIETAQRLHIHRNTLIQRIKRIEELCALDLRDPLQRLNCHVALKRFRLDQPR